LSKTNARTGILLYLDRRGRRFPSPKPILSNIIRIEISELIGNLDRITFEEIILREKKKAVSLQRD
jgi:hypothetical protein